MVLIHGLTFTIYEVFVKFIHHVWINSTLLCNFCPLTQFLPLDLFLLYSTELHHRKTTEIGQQSCGGDSCEDQLGYSVALDICMTNKDGQADLLVRAVFSFGEFESHVELADEVLTQSKLRARVLFFQDILREE